MAYTTMGSAHHQMRLLMSVRASIYHWLLITMSSIQPSRNPSVHHNPTLKTTDMMA